CVERSAIPAGARIHLGIRAEERSAFDVVGLERFHLLAEVVLRNVKQARLGRERGWLPVFAAGRRRADVADGLLDRRSLVGDVARKWPPSICCRPAAAPGSMAPQQTSRSRQGGALGRRRSTPTLFHRRSSSPPEASS